MPIETIIKTSYCQMNSTYSADRMLFLDKNAWNANKTIDIHYFSERKQSIYLQTCRKRDVKFFDYKNLQFVF